MKKIIENLSFFFSFTVRAMYCNIGQNHGGGG